MTGFRHRTHALARIGSPGVAATLVCLVGCVSHSQPGSASPYVKLPANGGGATSDGRPIDPLDNPQGSSLSLAVRAGELALGSVPYDGFVLPLISPDGRYAATQTSSPPAWPIVLAEPGATPPYATTVETFKLDTRLDVTPQQRSQPTRLAQVNTSVLLGRGCDSEGFLVEAPQVDGSRWIGKAAWETGEVRWLIQGNAVNAFAALAPDGRLAWSRRATDAEHFDLVVREVAGREWSVPAAGGDWLMPVWSTFGGGLYAMHRQNAELRICYGQATGPEAYRASLRDFLLMSTSDKYAAYQAFSGQGSLDGMAVQAGAPAGGGAVQTLLLHPGLGRMVLWKPLAPKNSAAVVLNARSLAAVLASPEAAIVCLRDEVVLQSLKQPDSHITLSPGTWVPRQTPQWSFPYVMLSPAEDRVQITALKLLPRENPAAATDATTSSR